MPQILFDTNHVAKYEMEYYQGLIRNIVSGSLRYPQIKKLAGTKYHNEDVYRAKIDKKNRLIFTYVQHNGQRTLMILAINDHNYGKVKRQLSTPNDTKKESYEIDVLPAALVSEKESEELSLLPAVSYNHMTLALDDSQQNALQQKTPLLLSGPPGAGKTVVLYNLMLKAIMSHTLALETDAQPAAAATSVENISSPRVLFISQSKYLIKNLKADFESVKQDLRPTVNFTTWADFLQTQYPGLSPADEKLFNLWLKEHLGNEHSDVVHYELSLIAALGEQIYQTLGERQCYFAGTPEKQQKLIKLLDQWQLYLAKNKLFDPMISTIAPDQKHMFDSIFCDEAQNLPPVALRYLIEHARDKRFIACLDSEQCLITSPYILSCLKVLLHKRYGTYSEHLLPKTWRCPSRIAEVANHLMRMKYTLDGNEKRRAYKEIEAVQSNGGLVSWINHQGLPGISHLSSSAETVVIAENLTQEERDYINEHLKTNNILTAREAIGLDFKQVILWKPFSQTQCLRALYQKAQKNLLTGGLNLEEWNTLNALYVAITRAQSSVYIFEDSEYSMQPGTWLLGELKLNEVNTAKVEIIVENEQKKWESLIENHLSEGREQVARGLMKFHLKMSDKEIEERIHPGKSVPKTTGSVSNEAVKSNADASKVPDAIAADKTPVPKETKRQTKRKTKKTTTKSEQETSEKKLSSPVNKYAAYITDLLSALSEKNIDNLINHKFAIEFLFGPHLKDGNCLFSKLLTEPKCGNYLLNKIAGNWIKFSNEFTSELLLKPCIDHPEMSILCGLSCLTNGTKILNQILINKPEQLKKLSARDWGIGLADLKGRMSVTVPFYWLTSNSEHIELLIKLLDLNPELIKEISVEDLCRLYVGNNRKFINTSPLYYLTGFPDGIKILNRLLDLNPDLAKKISREALCLMRSDAAETDANTSAFYWLCRPVEGQILLNRLLELDPTLAQKIVASALYVARGSNDNQSALLLLSYSAYGQNILIKLFQLNPELVKEIPLASFSAMSSMRSLLNASPLSLLSSTSKGIDFLLTLSNSNPAMGKGINVAALLVPVTATAGTRTNCIALYNLASNANGIKFLNNMLDQNPEIANEITAQALCIPRQVNAGSEVNTSVLSSLTTTREGTQLLKRIVLLNPSLLKGINAHALRLRRTPEAGLIANTSPLYWLCGFSEGREILLMLLDKNPDLAKSINSEDLSQQISFSSIDANATPFFWLSKDKNGYAILNKLLKLNPGIFTGITAETLCLKHIKSQLTPFYLLSVNINEQELLSTLMQQHPHLFKNITIEALCDLAPNEIKAFANTSALYCLSSTATGHIFLNNLMELNPELAKKISAKVLCSPRGVESNGAVNFSVLINLSSSLDGIKVLDKLLELNPELAKDMSIDDLHHKATQKVNEKEMFFTSFNLLSASPQGKIVLEKLARLNPQLSTPVPNVVLQPVVERQNRQAGFFPQVTSDITAAKAEEANGTYLRH